MVEQRGGFRPKLTKEEKIRQARKAKNVKDQMPHAELPTDEQLEQRSKEIEYENAEEERRQKGLIVADPIRYFYASGGKPRSKSRKTKRKNRKTRKTRRRRSKK